jgi:hypothetical protein
LATQCAIQNSGPTKKIETAIARIELWMLELKPPIKKMYGSIFINGTFQVPDGMLDDFYPRADVFDYALMFFIERWMLLMEGSFSNKQNGMKKSEAR